jgi:hypothetical protein
MRSTLHRNCGCGRRYDDERWAALRLFTRLTAAEVSPIVTPWPPHVVVEVRVCASCDRCFSRLVDLAARMNATDHEAFAA